ncbi:13505_t:CDS:2 [Gigaspora margarita]|uniref:13505_t:CDS:1 n=1 Tax=Gigaspora margarita TaxID=4874 RepID=A0ABM8W6Y3_GIGMA|nr:13505_t:CDS:2 [Gigaspora margarita]
MGRKYTKKITRAANIDPYKSLVEFYQRRVEFLERERKRVINFFKVYNIQGDNLSTRLASLQILIDEGENKKEKVKELQNDLYKRDTEINTLKDTIKRLTNEKDDFENRCKNLTIENNRLSQKIEEMNVDAERTERLHKQAIERARTNNRNLYEQTLAFSRQLSNQALINLYTLRSCQNTPVLQRTESVLDLESEPEPLPAHRREEIDLLGRFLYIPDETTENNQNKF